jgi:hypothetical protein
MVLVRFEEAEALKCRRGECVVRIGGMNSCSYVEYNGPSYIYRRRAFELYRHCSVAVSEDADRRQVPIRHGVFTFHREAMGAITLTTVTRWRCSIPERLFSTCSGQTPDIIKSYI